MFRQAFLKQRSRYLFQTRSFGLLHHSSLPITSSFRCFSTPASLETISTIETNYDDMADFAACYLIHDPESKQAAFIDNNTANCVPNLLQSLTELNLTPEDVKYLIVTHAHLDHAGGSSALLV